MLSKWIVDRNKLVTIILRFTNLTQLSFKLIADNDEVLRDLQRQTKLRLLSIGGPVSITSDGLVDLVRNLPDLQQLTLHHDSFYECIQMQTSTYFRICNIYEARNQKLVIYVLDTSKDDSMKAERQEPFAEYEQKEFVRYICFVMRLKSLYGSPKPKINKI